MKKVREEKIVTRCRKIWEESGRGTLLLAVSGGADSMALLYACILAHIPFETAHCNFNLRGKESLRDRDFVKMICTDFETPLHLAEFDTHEESLKGESLEMTCRRLRYEFFRNLKNECGFSRIAIAHNSDDNIETFFLNFLRGCGSRGLKGMDRDSGEIIRPLLDFSRKEILEFLNRHSVSYIVDSTNLHSDFRRNFLRNEIFPLLDSRWEGFRKAVATTISIQGKENAIVEQAVTEILKDNHNFLPWNVLKEFADPESLIFYFIKPYGGTSSIAHEISESAQYKHPGKKWFIGTDHTVVFTRDGILIEQDIDFERYDNPQHEYNWEKLKNTPLLYSKIFNTPFSEAYLPFDMSHYKWVYPTKEMKIKPLGMKGTQSVLKVLKDAGIPAHARKRFHVLTDKDTEEPIWIPGIKRSRLHLIQKDTEFIFHCTFLEKQAGQ